MTTMWGIYEVVVLGRNEDETLNIGEAESSAGWIARVLPEDLREEENDEEMTDLGRQAHKES